MDVTDLYKDPPFRDFYNQIYDAAHVYMDERKAANAQPSLLNFTVWLVAYTSKKEEANVSEGNNQGT